MRISTLFSRGDTLIEVLFATAIFSLVAVGALSIMNQGTETAQRALEITLVRHEIDSQAEMLRFLNSSYIAAYHSGGDYDSNPPAAQWKLMLDNIPVDLNNASEFGNNTVCPEIPDNSFIFNTKTSSFIRPSDDKLDKAKTFSQIYYNSSDQMISANGIWIEAVRSKTVDGNYQNNSGYIDFHIRACWDSPGQSVPVTIGTIVRLYEPRG